MRNPQIEGQTVFIDYFLNFINAEDEIIERIKVILLIFWLPVMQKPSFRRRDKNSSRFCFLKFHIEENNYKYKSGKNVPQNIFHNFG